MSSFFINIVYSELTTLHTNIKTVFHLHGLDQVGSEKIPCMHVF